MNPGNYADKKKFEEIDFSDESYSNELIRIEKKFTPLVLLCKKEGTAMRIGTNHGSLSDRILSRYGDTPEGMVESAMEFIRICRKNDYHNLVISMKASNTLVMVQAYRLLAAEMIQEGMSYPLHLGVTEAGDGEDGRIKSAVGIGALLEDGLGDTIRVSLTEDPSYEIPVAQKLIQKFTSENNTLQFDEKNLFLPYNPFEYKRRESLEINNVGGKHAPIVVADLSAKEKISPANFFGFGHQYSMELDKWNTSDLAADYVYIGNKTLDFEVPGFIKVITDYSNWIENHKSNKSYLPLIGLKELLEIDDKDIVCFVSVKAEEDLDNLKYYKNAIICLETSYNNKTQLFRKFICELAKKDTKNPIVLTYEDTEGDNEKFQLNVSSNAGAMLIDGIGDGIWIKNSNQSTQFINSTSFGILQATRTRISKTEYISCPSCGRTLFDLQETTGKIREKTSHLKGLKIGIMGCIVNGPGEMADADYGYVGTGPGKITLYKEKNVVRKNVDESEAVDELIDLIRENGDWVEPKK